jgi:hypothetical protein
MTAPMSSIAPLSLRNDQAKTIVVVTAIVAATLPVVVGVALLLSLITDRPTLARETRWWWNPLRVQLPRVTDAVVRRITAWWGVAFLIVGTLQGFAESLGVSITNPIGLLVRSLGAFALEAAIAATTVGYLRRRGA